MPTWVLVLFAMACGLTFAGLLASLHRFVVAGDGRAVGLSFAGAPQAIWSILVCTFAGPWLALTLAWPFWRRGDLAGHSMALVALVSGFWSFCSGVFVVQAALLVGLIST